MFRRSFARKMYIPKEPTVEKAGDRVNDAKHFMYSGIALLACGVGTFMLWGFDRLQESGASEPTADILRRRTGKKIYVIGCGAGGAAVSNIIVNQVSDSQVYVMDPAWKYYLTTHKALASVGHRSYDLRTSVQQTLEATTEWMCSKRANYLKTAPVKIDPKEQTITDTEGRVHGYDYLVLACGASQDVSFVKGLKEEDINNKSICVNPGYSRDVLASIYHGGVYVARVTPPEKYQRSCDNAFLGVSTNVWKYLHFFGKLSNHTGCQFKGFTGDKTICDSLDSVYLDELWKLYQDRKMEMRTGFQLVQINPVKHEATFQDVETKKKYPLIYKYLYLDLPLKVAEPMASVFGKNTHGFADVDPATLQHKEYKNVFALGDCAALPTIKSYGSVFAQAPVVCHNLVQRIDGHESTAQYDGYASFPLQMTTWRWMWPEMTYNNARVDFHLWDNSSWNSIGGCLNGFVVQESIYEFNFWLFQCAGQFHPQKWWGFPSFPKGPSGEGTPVKE